MTHLASSCDRVKCGPLPALTSHTKVQCALALMCDESAAIARKTEQISKFSQIRKGKEPQSTPSMTSLRRKFYRTAEVVQRYPCLEVQKIGHFLWGGVNPGDDIRV